MGVPSALARLDGNGPVLVLVGGRAVALVPPAALLEQAPATDG